MELDEVNIREHNGIFLPFQNNVISHSNMVLSEYILLNKLNIGTDAPVIYNGEEVGCIKNYSYSSDTGFYFLFFDLSQCENLPESSDYLTATLDFNITEIRCPHCENKYRIGESSCKCIFLSPVIYPEKLTIISMTIISIQEHGMPEKPCHTPLLHDFFGGAATNVVFADPI